MAGRRLGSRQVLTYSMREPGLFAQRLAAIKAAIDDSRCTRNLEIVMSTFQTGEICPFNPPGEVFRFRRVGSPPSEETGYRGQTAESAAAGPGGLTDIFGSS